MTESPRNSMHKFSPRRIFRGRGKTWMVPAAMLVIVLAVIAGALVMHSVSQRHLQLDDGTVWVTSQADQKAARYNVRLREPDASVTAQSPNFDIAQHGGDVILAEPQKASGIDQSTMGTADATATTSTWPYRRDHRRRPRRGMGGKSRWHRAPLPHHSHRDDETRHRRPNRHRRGRHRLRPRRPHGKGVHRRGWFEHGA